MQKGMSQADLARFSGVSQPTIHDLETGKQRTSRKLVDIADALGVPTSSLLGGNKESEVSVSKGKVAALESAEQGKHCMMPLA